MDRENVVGSWALRRVAHAQIISWVTFALIEGRPRVVAIGERGRLLVRTTMLRKKEGADVRATRPARRRREAGRFFSELRLLIPSSRPERSAFSCASLFGAPAAEWRGRGTM
jgi:hypothetical protein